MNDDSEHPAVEEHDAEFRAPIGGEKKLLRCEY